MKSDESSRMNEPAGVYGERLEPWSHAWHDELGLRYYQAIARKIEAAPGLRDVAIGNIDRWLAGEELAPGIQRGLLWWRDVLVNQPVSQLIRYMLDPSEAGKQRRQNTPFPGILTREERLRIRAAI